VRTDRAAVIQERVDLLIAGFPRFLECFARKPAFKRSGQYEFHRETVDLRAAAGSADAALRDPRFIDALYRTLRAWGIGLRQSRLAAQSAFAAALHRSASDIAAFDGMTLGDAHLDASVVSDRLWRLIDTLGIVENEAKLVAGTKALHHLIPNLVVPIDREFTGSFFGWHRPELQYRQGRCLTQALVAFARIARAVDPRQYVGNGWNTSSTKVIDNALVGLFIAAEELVAARSAG